LAFAAIASAFVSVRASASAFAAASQRFAALHADNFVSGVSGKGGHASAGTFVSGYAANPARKRVKMRIRRVRGANGRQNLV
jgi:hypothetical protein